MTIDEFMKETEVLPLILITFVGTILLILWVSSFKKKQLLNAQREIYGYNETSSIVEAHGTKLLEKRIVQEQLKLPDLSLIVNWCVFELSNGQRMQLAIEDSTTFNLMIEGDVGTLKHRGRRFIAFTH